MTFNTYITEFNDAVVYVFSFKFVKKKLVKLADSTNNHY